MKSHDLQTDGEKQLTCKQLLPCGNHCQTTREIRRKISPSS